MMFTGVPNLAWVFGYFRAAWTLRADLVADFVCWLLEHMERKGARKVTVALRPEDAGMPLLPWTDPEDFNMQPQIISGGSALQATAFLLGEMSPACDTSSIYSSQPSPLRKIRYGC